METKSVFLGNAFSKDIFLIASQWNDCMRRDSALEAVKRRSTFSAAHQRLRKNNLIFLVDEVVLSESTLRQSKNSEEILKWRIVFRWRTTKSFVFIWKGFSPFRRKFLRLRVADVFASFECETKWYFRMINWRKWLSSKHCRCTWRINDAKKDSPET